MIRKLLSKYLMEVVPSIVATVVGAYIVTHYINAKPAADKPSATATAPAVPAKAVGAVPAKVEAAKSEQARSEPARSEARKPEPAKPETAKADDTDTSNERTASRNPRHHQPVTKEKTATRPAAPAEAAAGEERRDANEIARAAIQRLRAEQPHAVDAKAADKAPERARVNPVVYTPPAPAVVPAPAAAPAQPLPAAVTSPPIREVSIPMAPVVPAATPIQSPVRAADDERAGLTPPADIPEHPLDLRAKDNKSVAEDVVSAARSVLRSVVPR